MYFNSSVLSEDSTQTQTFEVLVSTFHHYFQKADHYKVGTALVSFKKGDMINPL